MSLIYIKDCEHDESRYYNNPSSSFPVKDITVKIKEPLDVRKYKGPC